MTLNAFTLHIFQPYSTLLLAIVTMLLDIVYIHTQCVQVIIWKEVNGTWNKIYEFGEHKSSGKFLPGPQNFKCYVYNFASPP